MNELYLYDRDKGLFKEVLRHSNVIGGRYHISPDYGHTLNTDNLKEFLKDPKNGISDPAQKYPITVCMPPQSVLSTADSPLFKEDFIFQLFFLCTTGYTGQNKIKSLDKATNTSAHHTWYDWKDMKEVALEFLVILRKTIRQFKLKRYFAIDFTNIPVRRLSNFNTDGLSGVSISFSVNMVEQQCINADYPEDILEKLTIPDPDYIIHPLHKH